MTVACAGFATFLVACGDDDDGTSPPRNDGGPGGDSQTGNDSGTQGDTGTQPEASVDAGPVAKIQFVSAHGGLGPSTPSGGIRICYALGKDEASAFIAPIPPLPDRKANPALPFAGVFQGQGGGAESTGTDLTGVVLIPYLMSADRLAALGEGERPQGGPGKSCEDLLKPDAAAPLVEGVDYWKLPALNTGTTAGLLNRNKSVLLTLTGCAGNATASAVCGTDFVPGAAGNGNLKVNTYELDLTPPDPAKIGAQFINASAAGTLVLQAVPETPGVIPGFTDGGADGFQSVNGNQAVAYNAAISALSQNTVAIETESFTANKSSQLRMPLKTIERITYGGGDAGALGQIRNGAGFTFVAVGDPLADPDGGAGGAIFNYRFFHFVALPNNPPAAVYRP